MIDSAHRDEEQSSVERRRILVSPFFLKGQAVDQGQE